MATDRRPCFFKLMVGNLNTEHLRIPPAFMKHITENLLDTANLRGPSGGNWQVRLVKHGDRVFMEDGWQEFSRDHSLGHNEFLLFSYEGNMCFSVQIFERTQLERIPNSQLANKSEEVDLDLEVDMEMETNVEKVKEKKHKRGKAKEKTSIRRTAKSFTSVFPYFEKCLKPYHVYQTLTLDIPPSFAQAYFPDVKTKMMLRNSEGEVWEVNCVPYQGKHTFCGGFRAFIRDNYLKPGDICIFELVKSGELQFHVFKS